MTQSPRSDDRSDDPGMKGARMRVADLSDTRPREVDLRPGPDTLAALAEELELQGLRKVSLTGTLRPEGKRDWVLDARLGATVVQSCVVTLKPVTTRIEEKVQRRYTPDMPQVPAGGEEVEMPEDDTLEPLRGVIDLGAVLTEALSLALPPYPRAEGAEAGEAVFAEPSVEPLRDEDVKPFAGLAALKDKLEGK